jgi:hypothetical protein
MPKRYLIDMDGILLRGTTLIPGADAFPARPHRHVAGRDRVVSGTGRHFRGAGVFSYMDPAGIPGPLGVQGGDAPSSLIAPSASP